MMHLPARQPSGGHGWACLGTAGPRGCLCRQPLGHTEGGKDKFKHRRWCAKSWLTQARIPRRMPRCGKALPEDLACCPQINAKGSHHLQARLSSVRKTLFPPTSVVAAPGGCVRKAEGPSHMVLGKSSPPNAPKLQGRKKRTPEGNPPPPHLPGASSS